MSEPLSKVLGLKRKKESPHDGHTMDDNWCYDCDMIVQDGDLPFGNHRYNNALDDLDQLSPDAELLEKVIEDWDCDSKNENSLAQEIINKIDVWIVKKG